MTNLARTDQTAVHAELDIIQTSHACVRYRLLVHGRRVWSNRVAPVDAGHEGARARMAAWALRHGYVVERAAIDAQRAELAPAYEETSRG